MIQDLPPLAIDPKNPEIVYSDTPVLWKSVEGGKTAVVTAAIDNLMKGAASQAVQAFNARFGFDERTALDMYAAAV